MRVVHAVLIAAMVKLLATDILLAAQHETERPGGTPQWSPLAPLSELARPAAPAVAFPSLLEVPPPQLGLAWTAGNPAAFASELRDDRAEFHGRFRSESGDFSRPLDAGRTRSLTGAASGWRRLGASGGVIGSVALERASLRDGAPADMVEPHSMSPHSIADTSGSNLGRTLARLEGAGGWALGPWGVGLGLGYQSWDTRTDVTLVPRYQRGSRSGASVGMSRAFGTGDLVVGTKLRWLSGVEAVSLNTRQAPTRIYLFEGYGEPVVVDLDALQGFSRRIERESASAGLAAALDLDPLRLAVFADLTRLTERQSSESTNDPPTDHWDAAGLVLGIAAERGAMDDRGRLTALLKWLRVSGDAKRAGLEEEGELFDAAERVVDGTLDYRLRRPGSWELGARLVVTHEDRSRHDLLARIRSSLASWRPAIALEAAHEIGGGVALGLGAGVAWHTPRGGIPNPAPLGEGYRQWIGPELSYYGTAAQTTSAVMTGRWRTAVGREFSLAIRYSRASPRRSDVTLPLAPEGSRGAFHLSFAWAITEGEG